MSLPKVCHVLHDDGPGGGPVFIVDQLKATLGKVEASVIHGGRGRIAEYCEAAGIPHWQIAIDRQSRLPIGFFQLVGALRKAKPDIAVIYGQWAGPITPPAMKLAGVKHSIYSCQWPSFYTDWDLKRVIRNRISEAIPCRMCDRVVAISEGSMYQYAIRKLGAGKTRLIHNCVDLARIPSPEKVRAVREAEKWGSEHCHVVSVGRLADQKCVDWLLRSWRMVQEQKPNARLWIVGDGPEEAMLRRLAEELKITGTCTFLGSRPNGIEYVGAGDIVAMTTLYEAHGIVALEAMGCGRPIVVSDVDGPHNSLENGVEGFLVKQADIEGFAEKLMVLIDDPALRERMGAAGRVRAEQFSVARISAQYLALIEEVLAEGAAKGRQGVRPESS